MVLKKNIKIFALLVVLLAISTFLYVLNYNLNKELVAYKIKTNYLLKKVDHYSSLKKTVRSVLNKDSVSYLNDTNDVRLMSDLTLLGNNFHQLKDTLISYNNQKKVIANQQRSLQKLFSSSSFLEENLKLTEDKNLIISNVLNQVSLQNDSLIKGIKSIQQTLLNTKIDTITFTSANQVNILYFGHLFQNSATGLGIGFYNQKGYYMGEWLNNMRNGFGKHFYLNGDKFEGCFLNDKRDGFGKYYYASGDVYEGEWENDLMNGQGKLNFAAGKVFYGVWKAGKLIENTKP